MENTFYVYEHWRPDLDVCFYVGKGTGRRCKIGRQRNSHHNNIVAKLNNLGMCVEVRMYKSGLSEKEALQIEKERISFWRNAGVDLVNKTAGGDGMLSPTDNIRQKMSKSQQKRWENAEEKRKIVAEKTKLLWNNQEYRLAQTKARLGKKVSEDTKKKMSLAHKNKPRSEKTKEKFMGENNPFWGKTHSIETINKIIAKKTGSKHSEETKARMRESQRLRRLKEMEAA